MRSELKKMMDYCTFCPKMCHFSCPTSEATGNETYTPWGKMEIARWITDKTLPLSPELALSSYQCTNCLHCQQYCEHGNDVPSALAEVRRIAVENYAAPPQVYSLEERFLASNNPYGEDLSEKTRAYRPRRGSGQAAKILFLPSCHTLHYFPARIATYFELFEKLRIEDVALFDGAVQCCGAPLDALGFSQDFQEVAEVQYHAVKDYRVIVTDGPECCHTLKHRYAQLHLPLQKSALHLLEFLAPYLTHSNYRSEGRVKGRLAYHDPAYLSRHLGIVDLPRKILGELTGFPPLELSWSGKDSLSSGTEGDYDVIFPEYARKIAQRTVDEIESRGIGKLITACAKSEVQFRGLGGGFAVQDIYEFLNEQILPGVDAAT